MLKSDKKDAEQIKEKMDLINKKVQEISIDLYKNVKHEQREQESEPEVGKENKEEVFDAEYKEKKD